MLIKGKQYLSLSEFSYNSMIGIDKKGMAYNYRGKAIFEVLEGG